MGAIDAALAAAARLVLRFRRLTVVVGFAAALSCAYYAATRLGINTDTADMISPELSWRQDFIRYRRLFPARDRNIVIVVDAASPARADEFTSALVERLKGRSDLYRSVFAAGVDEFFARNGLLYSSVDELEELSDRLAEAQPLLGLLQPEASGAAVVGVVDRMLAAERDGADEPIAAALYRELADAVRGAVNGAADRVEWRALIGGEVPGDANARRLVLLQPLLDFSRPQPAAEAIRGIRGFVDELAAEGFTSVTVRLTGPVAMEHEEMRSVQSGASLAGILSFVMVGTLLYATLRSFKLLVISITTLAIGLTGAAAFAAAAVGHLNLLSVAFAVMYIGLGTDFIIHVCLRVKELLAAGLDRDEAIVQTVRGIGSSLVIAAVTTAAGFYAFIPTAFDGVAELGLISGTGMFISLIASVTLLPALLGLFLTDADRRPRRAWIGTRRLAVLTARPVVVVTVTAVLVAVTFAVLPAAEFDGNPLHMRDPDAESVRALDDLARDGQAAVFDLAAIAPDHATAVDWAARLRALDTVRSVTTIDALVPDRQEDKLFVLEDLALVMGPNFGDLQRAPPDADRLEQALRELEGTLDADADLGPGARELDTALAALLESLADAPEPARRRMLDTLDDAIVGNLPGDLARLEASLEAEAFGREALPAPLAERWGADDGSELIEISPREDVDDNAAAARFVDSVRAIVPTATGLPVVYREASRTVVGAFQAALIYALLMVTVLLVVFLRNVRDVLLVVVPILLATGATVGVSVLLGIPLNFASIIGLPLLVGIGVDNGIHIVHRMRTEPSDDGQVFGTSTSLAVLASNLTTIVSFGNLGFSPHRGMASMGQLLTFGMILTLAASMLLLPALLALMRRPSR